MSYKRGGANLVEYCSLEHLSPSQIRRLYELFEEIGVDNCSVGYISEKRYLIIGRYSSPLEGEKVRVQEEITETIKKIEENDELSKLIHSYRYKVHQQDTRKIVLQLKDLEINNYTFAWLGDQKYLVLTGKNPPYQTHQEIGRDILEAKEAIEQSKELKKLLNPQDLRTKISSMIERGISAIKGAYTSLKK